MDAKTGIGLARGDMFFALPYWLGEPDRGDIVLFSVPAKDAPGKYRFLVKRIVGLPRDTLAIRDGKIWIDGTPLKGASWSDSLVYAPGPELGNSSGTEEPPGLPVSLADKEYFILGDNARDTLDSRTLGPIAENQILRRVVFRYAPLGRMGWVE